MEVKIDLLLNDDRITLKTLHYDDNPTPFACKYGSVLTMYVLKQNKSLKSKGVQKAEYYCPAVKVGK